MRHIHRWLSLIVLVCLLAVPAYAEKEIGTIISLTPAVQVERGGKAEAVELKSGVYKSDVLQSSPSGKAQILLVDDTTIAVAPNTQVRMEEFALEEEKSSFTMQLTHGLARVVTGKIVESNPDGFIVKTPRATTGIRGTDVTIMDDGVKTTVISNAIHKRDIVVTNHATGEVSRISQSGILVESTGAGNLMRPATPEERTTAMQAARRSPPSKMVADSKSTTGSTGSSGGSGSTGSGGSGGNGGTASGYEGDDQSASGGRDVSVPVTLAAKTPETSVPNMDLKGEPKLPAVTPPVPDPVPPAPTPDPVPPMPDPEPDPVPPVPNPEPDPVPPAPEPEPDPVPPVPDPEPDPVPPTPGPLPPNPGPGPDPNPDNPLNVTGGFSGGLMATTRSGAISGEFQMEVALSDGSITKGFMVVEKDSRPVFAGYGGTGSMSGSDFSLNTWTTKVGGDGSLSGTFTDADSISNLTWNVTADNGTLWNGLGVSGSYTNVAEGALPDKAPNASAISGSYSGVLGGAGVTDGNFKFGVELATGKIRDASMRMRKTGADLNFFDGYEGTGVVVGSSFSVSNWGLLNYGKAGTLSGTFDSSKFIGSADWSATDNNDATLSGTGGTFSHSAGPHTPDSPNRSEISGGYKGDFSTSSLDPSVGMDRGDFQFNVDLRTGNVSGASMRGFKADGSVLFGAYLGTGKMSGSRYGFLVQDWGKKSDGTFKLYSASFDPGSKNFYAIEWSADGDFGSQTGFGDSVSFTHDPNGYVPLNPAVSGRYSGALLDGSNTGIGTFDLNLDIESGQVTHAALSGSLGGKTFSAIGGTGTVSGEALSVAFMNDTDTTLTGTVKTDATGEQTLTGIRWGTKIDGADVTYDGRVAGFDPVVANKGPEHIQGTFAGTASIDATHTADIGFRVALGSGALSDSSLNIRDTTIPSAPVSVFEGSGGSGGAISATDYSFAVTGLSDAARPAMGGQFAGKFTSGNGGTIENWRVNDSTPGASGYSGANMPFTKNN